MPKIYGKGNYIFVEIDGYDHPLVDAKSDTVISPLGTDNDVYRINSDIIGDREFNFSDITDENGDAYTKSEWDYFWMNETAFNYALLDGANKLKVINDKSDFPLENNNNEINLLDNVTYWINGTIDLMGCRLIGGQNTTIIGASSENSILTSTGLGVGVPLLSSNYSLPFRHVSIKDVDTALDFDGTGNTMALDWTGVNFVNIPNVGIIKKASNFILSKSALLNSNGLKFDGEVGTIGIDNSLFLGNGTATNIIEVLPTAIINTRFRTTYSSIVAFGSSVGINFSVSAQVPVESYILDTVNFSGGSTYLSGVDVEDNKTNFSNCKGIKNSAEISNYYMNGNATPTIISVVGAPVKVLGATLSNAVTQKFENTNNRSTYVGSITRFFKLTATVSLISGNNNQIGCYFAKNGLVIDETEVYGTANGSGRAENIVIQGLVELTTNDYIDVFVENSTGTANITVTDLNVIIN